MLIESVAWLANNEEWDAVHDAQKPDEHVFSQCFVHDLNG